MTRRSRTGSSTDVMTPEQRSWCMSKIRGRNTGPELALRHALWCKGLRYRLKSALPGRPDIIFPSRRVALFVDGCFWHGCPQHGTSPKANSEFWRDKIRRNIERDRKMSDHIQNLGWTVLRFWEHEIDTDLSDVVRIIESTLRKPLSGTTGTHHTSTSKTRTVI
jgi:DNA mismatch endonuclease, patch repair protein